MTQKENIVDDHDETKTDQGTTGKGRATPTRKEREAARKKPLVPHDRKEAAKAARAQNYTERERARIGLAAGEEKYLLTRDRGPQRRYVRDYVDARFSLGEFMIPVMFIVILLSLIPERAVQTGVMLGLYAFILLVLVDSAVLGLVIIKRIREKFGANAVEKGLRWYAGMRALQLRRMRLPKPQVKRREYPS